MFSSLMLYIIELQTQSIKATELQIIEPVVIEETLPSNIEVQPTPKTDPAPKEKLQGDLNKDGCVNMEDKALIEYNWGRTGDDIKGGDANKDGVINIKDLSTRS